MKRAGFILLTVFVFLYLFTGVLFAQTKLEIIIPGRVEAQTDNLTPTPKTVQPTSDPSPTVTQAPAPTAEVTSAPTPVSNQTSVPENTQQTQTAGPIATPTPLPPTPTPKPKHVVLPVLPKKPPAQPINQIITAPFDLVMSSLPQSYYSNEGLAPETNKVLLSLAFLCLLSGTFLLKWPALSRAARRVFAPRGRETDTIPYLPGRAQY